MATLNESRQETQSTPAVEDMVITDDNEPNNNESEFNRKTIDSLGNRVRLTDKDETSGLELFCYVQCNSNDTLALRQCRGVVFHEDQLVMQAFPYTIEYVHTDLDIINNNLGNILNECKFFDAYEGNLIRMFYFSDRWYISTHRKLNAFRSKWAARESFGTCFKKALDQLYDDNEQFRNSIPDGEENLLDRFQNTLDKNKQYMFLVMHSIENRIVCSTPENPTVYHVGSFVNGKLDMEDNCNVPYPQEHTFKNINDVVEHVKNVDIRYLQGLICFGPDNKQYKIIHKEYNELFRARGNEPSIKFRYIQTRMNRRVVDMLYHLYPDMSKTFEEIENSIYQISKNIYNSYVQRFIKKKFVTVPTEEFNVIKECHKWHEVDRVNNRINIDKVIEILNQQTPTSINRMIRRYRTEQNEGKLVKKNSQDRLRSSTVTSETEAKNQDNMEE